MALRARLGACLARRLRPFRRGRLSDRMGEALFVRRERREAPDAGRPKGGSWRDPPGGEFDGADSRIQA